MEPEATRQDGEAAVNDGMKTQVSIDGRQLFVHEIVDKNLEEEYTEEINESSDKCHEPETHHEFGRSHFGSSYGLTRMCLVFIFVDGLVVAS